MRKVIIYLLVYFFVSVTTGIIAGLLKPSDYESETWVNYEVMLTFFFILFSAAYVSILAFRVKFENRSYFIQFFLGVFFIAIYLFFVLSAAGWREATSLFSAPAPLQACVLLLRK